jgi:hypothetical protein
MKQIFSLLFLLLVSVIVRVQGQSSSIGRQLNVTKTSRIIEIDGLLNEEDWNRAALADDFLKYWPMIIPK